MIGALNNALTGLGLASKQINESANNIANITTPGIGENVNLEEELVNLKISETVYKANVQTIATVDELSDDLLRILDEKV